MITVDLSLMFADILGKKRVELDVGEAINLEGLSEKLGLNYDDMGIMLINKKWAPLKESEIQDGDHVQLYPFMEGG